MYADKDNLDIFEIGAQVITIGYEQFTRHMKINGRVIK